MYPKKYQDKWTEKSLLFFVAVFKSRAMGLNYDYVNKFTRESAKGIKIKLPIDKIGNPDFSYMETYMKNLEVAVSSSLTALQSAKNSKKSIQICKWGNFLISDLFDVVKGKRLTKANMKDGNIPFIGASAVNNGITSYISNDEYIHPANTITLSYNGSVGESFYQKAKFWASDDVNVLYPRFKMNIYSAMFIIPCLKAVGKNYAFIDKWKKEDMEKAYIRLPINLTGTPDYKYMENYMKAIEQKMKTNIGILSAI